MDTLTELEKYLEHECFSFTQITIGKHFAPEGYVIEEKNEEYNFCYSERGNKRIIKTFSEEKALVEYAFHALNNEKWSKSHLVAWVWSECEIKEAEQILAARNISYTRNDIPNYSKGKTAYRIFVFGRDVLLLNEYKKKYMKR